MFLYLSIEANKNSNNDPNDVVVLVVSPSDGGSPTDDRRIIIYPNAVGGPVTHYWTNSSTWDGLAGGPPPSGFSMASRAATGQSWNVELSIPISSFDLPTGSNFGLYFDVILVNGSTGQAVQYYWPSFAGNGLHINPETFTQPPGNWGNGTLSPTAVCNGVSLNWQDITSNHPPDQIDATCKPGPAPNCTTQSNSNTFTAVLHNSSIDGAGNFIAANNITAKFSIANFGLTANWTPVPVTPNPVPVASPIPAATSSSSPGTASVSTSSWSITDLASINNYRSHPDQCILVELDSSANPGTPPDCSTNAADCITLANKSVKRNMWVINASDVSKAAEVSAKGYDPNPTHPDRQEFVLHVLSRQEVLSRGQLSGGIVPGRKGGASRGGAGRVNSRLTWAVAGCRLTGEYIVINGHRYETCDDVGAFGAIVDHSGRAAVVNWLVDLAGAGLSKIDAVKNTYRIVVPQGDVANIDVRFAPHEKSALEGKFATFPDLGAAVPHGTFGNGFNTGFSLNAGLEYMISPHFSAEGIFGYHHFPAKTTGDLNIYQFSANGKTYLTTGHMQPFINGGIGGYKLSSGDAQFGGNVGAGLLFNITSRFGVQASYNFHIVNTPTTATRFFTFQGGIRYVLSGEEQ